MPTSKRIIVVVAFLLLATALLIRAASAAAPPRLERWVFVEIPAPAPVELASDPPRRPEPYVGWERWCEPVVPAPCHKDRDCGPAPDGRAQRCVVPWWANRKLPRAERERVCASPWPRRSEQAWRRARLESVIAHVCRRPSCDPTELGAFVGVVAQRESTWRPWKAHRLNGDLRANRIAWSRVAARYGGNPHYRERGRWQGLGLFGSNAALFTFLWDPKAPPEILCREIEAIDTYLARARIATRKQASLGVSPTWATVHAALATGKIRPTAASVDRFRGPARRVGIDPDEAVSARAFGDPLGADVLSRRLAAELLRLRIDARLGRRFVALGS